MTEPTNPLALNRCLVGLMGDHVVISLFARRLSRDDALNLAAWLVATADAIPGETSFDEVLNAVRST